MLSGFRETTLPNGLRVATVEMPRVGSVSMGLWIGVGGRYESRRMSGVSHFIEHMLFKGTRRRSARAISEAVEGRGGYLNAFTQEESTCYYARIAADYATEVLDVLTDMYVRPAFNPHDLAMECGVVVDEIMMYRDRPQSAVEDMLGELLWANHALGRPLVGTPENVCGMTRADVIAFKNSRYVPNNTVAVFAGKVEHDQWVREVARRMGRMKPGRKVACRKVTRKTGQRFGAVQSRDIEQAHLAMGFRLFGRHDRRRYPLKLLSVMLGENMSSRLFQTVRERHGLAYSVQSSTHLFEETGVLSIQAGLDRAKAGRAFALILKELTKFKKKPVSARELRRAKDYAIGQFRLGLESTSSQMMWVGENLIGYGRVTGEDQVVRDLEAVTAESVQRLALTVLNYGRASVAMIVPGDAPSHERLIGDSLADL